MNLFAISTMSILGLYNLIILKIYRFRELETYPKTGNLTRLVQNEGKEITGFYSD